MMSNFRIRESLTFLILAVFLSCLATCNSSSHKETKTDMPTRDINAVMADHTAELMAIPGVTGLAVGETENKTPCVLILVEKDSDELSKKLPKTLEGYPVRLLVSGKIVPLDGK